MAKGRQGSPCQKIVYGELGGFEIGGLQWVVAGG
jgi:hypothetical protein